MATGQSFEDFLLSGSVELNLFQVFFASILALVLSFILSQLYIKYGTSLSNRRQFAKTFILLTVTTTLVITIVKSSLALSLGLVGALSIVRFRAAIKEPEELAFLFLCITIGLGLGANQWVPTVMVFALLCVVIYFRKLFSKREDHTYMYLNVVAEGAHHNTLQSVVHILTKECSQIHLSRLDEKKDTFDALFRIEADSFKTLNDVRKQLKKVHDGLKIVYLDRL